MCPIVRVISISCEEKWLYRAKSAWETRKLTRFADARPISQQKYVEVWYISFWFIWTNSSRELRESHFASNSFTAIFADRCLYRCSRPSHAVRRSGASTMQLNAKVIPRCAKKKKIKSRDRKTQKLSIMRNTSARMSPMCARIHSYR